MTALLNKHHSGHRKATETEEDRRTCGKRDLVKDMRTAVSNTLYSWRKMKATAQDRAGWTEVVCGLCSTGGDTTHQ